MTGALIILVATNNEDKLIVQNILEDAANENKLNSKNKVSYDTANCKITEISALHYNKEEKKYYIK